MIPFIFFTGGNPEISKKEAEKIDFVFTMAVLAVIILFLTLFGSFFYFLFIEAYKSGYFS